MGTSINGAPVGGSLPASAIGDLLSGATPSRFVATDAGGASVGLTAAQAQIALGLVAQPALNTGSIVPGTNVTGSATATAYTATIASGALANAVATNTVAWPAVDTSTELTARVVCSGSGAGVRAAILKLLYGGSAAGNFLEIDVDDTGNVSLLDHTGSLGGQSAPTPTRATTWVRLRICGKRVTAWNSSSGVFASPFYDADLAWLVVSTAGSYATIASIFASGGQYSATANATGSVTIDNLTLRAL